MVFAEPVNMTGLVSMMEYANTVSDNLFGILVCVSLYLIVIGYLNGKGENILDSMTVGGYITSVVGIMLFLMGLIEGQVLFYVFISLILPLILTYFSKSG